MSSVNKIDISYYGSALRSLNAIVSNKEKIEEDFKVVDNVPYEDLPLYANRKWTSKEAYEIFKNRLSEGY